MRKALGWVSRIEKRARREKSSGRKIFQYRVEEKKEGGSEARNDGASPLLSLLFFLLAHNFASSFFFSPPFPLFFITFPLPQTTMVASKIVGYVRSAAASIVRCVLRNGVERASERKRESNLSPASLEKSKKGGEGVLRSRSPPPALALLERAGASLRVPLHHSQVERVFSARLSAILDARNEGRRVLSSREIWFDGAGEKPGRESRRRPATTTTALAQLLKNAPPVVFPHSILTQQLRPLHGQGQEGVLCGQEGKDLRASLF